MPAKIKITEDHKHIIREGAGCGLTIKDIARIAGISPRTLDRWMTDEEVKECYETGRAIAKQKVVGKLFDLIEKGEPAAIFFYLKCQCGWKEKADVIQSTEQIQIYLPAKESSSDKEYPLNHEQLKQPDQLLPTEDIQ
jgi:transcriptional regulator with XRE-family HTH domain